MLKMYQYADQRGDVYYATSPQAFARYAEKTREITASVFQGTRLVEPAWMVRIARGVYRPNPY